MSYLTEPVLTRYEEARVIGMRAKQLASGDPPRIPLKENHHYTVNDVARLEYEARLIPYVIERQLPTGEKEQWSIADMRPAK